MSKLYDLISEAMGEVDKGDYTKQELEEAFEEASSLTDLLEREIDRRALGK